jgi:hypothetical protein
VHSLAHWVVLNVVKDLYPEIMLILMLEERIG